MAEEQRCLLTILGSCPSLWLSALLCGLLHSSHTNPTSFFFFFTAWTEIAGGGYTHQVVCLLPQDPQSRYMSEQDGVYLDRSDIDTAVCARIHSKLLCQWFTQLNLCRGNKVFIRRYKRVTLHKNYPLEVVNKSLVDANEGDINGKFSICKPLVKSLELCLMDC